VPAKAIAEAPYDFDVLASVPSITLVVTQGVGTLLSGRLLSECKPYSRTSCITVVVLPSCRLSNEGLAAVEKLYRYPSGYNARVSTLASIVDATPLETPVDVLPHDTAVVWMVGADSVSYAAFGGCLTNPAPPIATGIQQKRIATEARTGMGDMVELRASERTYTGAGAGDGYGVGAGVGTGAGTGITPGWYADTVYAVPDYSVTVQSVRTGDIAPSADAREAQHEVERAWFWCKPTTAATYILPVTISRMATVADSPFQYQRGSTVERLDTNVVRFQSALTADEMTTLMTSHQADIAAVRNRWWDVHFMDAHSGMVVPAWLSLQACSVEIKEEPAYVSTGAAMYPPVDPASDDRPDEPDCLHPNLRMAASSQAAALAHSGSAAGASTDMDLMVYVVATCILATPGARAAKVDSGLGHHGASAFPPFDAPSTPYVHTTFPSYDGRGRKS
jgi:hypothetical protein